GAHQQRWQHEGEGDRQVVGAGHRARTAGRPGSGRRRRDHRLAAGAPTASARLPRDVRGPPHGDGAGRRRRASAQRRHQGPELREQDLPGLLHRPDRPAQRAQAVSAAVSAMADAPPADPAASLPVVTLDGPAASGKSSVAKLLAHRLGVAYVSSGLLYRAATLLALEAGLELTDEPAVLALLDARTVRLIPGSAGNSVEVDGGDVAALLHTDE